MWDRLWVALLVYFGWLYYVLLCGAVPLFTWVRVAGYSVVRVV